MHLTRLKTSGLVVGDQTAAAAISEWQELLINDVAMAIDGVLALLNPL